MWLAAGTSLAALSAQVALGAQTPILAGPWSLHQKGYGHSKPATIFNGGDPTGLLTHIQWQSWGGSRAIGTGTAEYVGPHQIVAEGTSQQAKIVLFKLGSCKGKRAYDAIEWYFPQHGQRFKEREYIDPCTGTYYPQAE